MYRINIDKYRLFFTWDNIFNYVVFIVLSLCVVSIIEVIAWFDIYKQLSNVYSCPNDDFYTIASNLVMHNLSKYFILYILFSYLYFKIYDLRYKKKLEDKTTLHVELETKVQREMAVSAHHEMGVPLGIIKSAIEQSMRETKLYNDTYTSTSHPAECLTKITSQYETILLAVDRLESVLRIMAKTKKIRYNNGTISLYNMITTVGNGINAFRIDKVRIVMQDADLLNKYAVGVGLSNGEVMNVIHNMIVNSAEAEATTITIKPNLIDSKRLAIHIIDNGHGILDVNGDIISTSEIFNNGYSTKDSSGKHIEDNWGIRVLNKLGILEKRDLVRGVGLSISKAIIKRGGGDVILLNTSQQGTVFKIIIPIKQRRK